MEEKISSIETKITIYSWIGWIFVILAIIPILNVGYDVFILSKPWPEDDLGSFMGGVSGTFAALAGVFFVFVAFLGQRISIIQQQIEIKNNIQELRDTREEIKGQKKQLELQNKQFQIQAFGSVFFNLLDLYKKQSALSFSKGYGDEQLIEKLKKFYQSIKIEHLSDSWNLLDKREKAIKLGETFDFSFSQGFARVRALISSVLGVLIHLDENRTVIDHEFYLSIFYTTLNVHETRIVFYGFFSDKFQLDQTQTKLLQEFYEIFITDHLCFSEDKKLIKI